MPAVETAYKDAWDSRPRLPQEPVLRQEHLFAWACFAALNKRRSYSMNGVPSAVGFADFEAWCRLSKVSGERAEQLWRVVELIDDGWMELMNKKRDSGGDGGSQKPLREFGLNPPEDLDGDH